MTALITLLLLYLVAKTFVVIIKNKTAMTWPFLAAVT